MKTLTQQKLEIGSELSFDESASVLAVRRAEILIPAIIDVRDSYEKLNLEPFTAEIFAGLYQGGDSVDRIRCSLKKQVDKDLKGFKTAIIAKQTMQDAEILLDSLRESIDDLRRGFMDESSFTRYPFSPADFVIEDSQVSVNESRIREYYTERVQTQAQVDAYEKLQHCAEVLNETVDFIEHSGFKFPSRHNLYNVFFVHEIVGEDFTGSIYGPRVIVAEKQLKLLMTS